MADEKLTEEEMASLFDAPIGPITPELVAAFGPGPNESKSTQRALAEADAYQRAAEVAFQAGLVVGKGDATYQVRDELKRMGCKWHALRERWVAPDKATLQSARVVVQRGPVQQPAPIGIDPVTPDWLKAKIGKQKPNVQSMAKPDPRAVLIDLEQRGLIKLPRARMQALMDGDPPTEDELNQAFAETDKAFDL